MIMLYALVLTGTLFHAASNVWQKHLLNEGAHPRYVTIVWMFGASLVGFTGNFLFHGIPSIAGGSWYQLFFAGAILNTSIMLLDVKSRKLEDVSIVAPIAALAPLVSVPIAIVFLGEWTTFWGFIGIAGTIPGLYLLGRSNEAMPPPPGCKRSNPISPPDLLARWIGPLRQLAASRGAQFAFLVACLGAVAVNVDKPVVLGSNPLFRTGATFGFVALALFLDSFVRGEWQEFPRSWPLFMRILATGIFIGIADAFYGAGYYFGIVPYVAALKRVQALWSVLLGWRILGEPYGLRRLAGSAILILGILFLAF